MISWFQATKLGCHVQGRLAVVARGHIWVQTRSKHPFHDLQVPTKGRHM